jgi:hypothetical protein
MADSNQHDGHVAGNGAAHENGVGSDDKGILSQHNDDLENVTLQDEQFADIDEKKVLRKMDLRLLPMLSILYLLCFLDRGNIGNAKIEGMEQELDLVGNRYGLCCMDSIPLHEQTCHCHSHIARPQIAIGETAFANFV